jgi:hypothetical protein
MKETLAEAIGLSRSERLRQRLALLNLLDPRFLRNRESVAA